MQGQRLGSGSEKSECEKGENSFVNHYETFGIAFLIRQPKDEILSQFPRNVAAPCPSGAEAMEFFANSVRRRTLTTG